ncbi:hypothetical protein GGF32_008887, partial [Allomyces javanicus]
MTPLNGDDLARIAAALMPDAHATVIPDFGHDTTQTQIPDHQAQYLNPQTQYLGHQIQDPIQFHNHHVLIATAGSSANALSIPPTNPVTMDANVKTAVIEDTTPMKTTNMNPPTAMTATASMMPPMTTTTTTTAGLTLTPTTPLFSSKSDMPKSSTFAKTVGSHWHLTAEFYQPPMNVDEHLQAVSLLMEIAAVSDASVTDQTKKAALVYSVEKALWLLLVGVPEWRVGSYADFAAQTRHELHLAGGMIMTVDDLMGLGMSQPNGCQSAHTLALRFDS